MFAFLGGLILNLMPCVFPILAMKAASLAGHGEDQAEARNQGMAFGVGSVLTFIALAGVLIALKAAGSAIGWGFQLQSPPVVAVLALLMLAVALNLSGLFEVGTSLQGAGTGLASRGGAAGAFFTGALAVVVAAPCTAPFMGPALGWALTQTPVAALTVFLFLGIGFAAPFVLVAYAPGLLSRLPRPGAWMETFRKALAFPMYGAAAWLAWVLAQQAGAEDLAKLFAAAVLVGLAAWLAGLSQRRAVAAGKKATGDGADRRLLCWWIVDRRRRLAPGQGRRTRLGALQPRALGGATRGGPTRVRQLHRRLVRLLPGQRQGGALHPHGRRGLRAPQGRLFESRLDQARPGHRRGPRQPRSGRRAALPGLWQGRRRGRYPAVNPDAGYRGQGGGGRGQALRRRQPEPMTVISRRLALAAGGLAVLAPNGSPSPPPGWAQPAPAFKALDAAGHERALSDFAGKIVVLEWTSSDCPYCGKHYGSGNMQALQKKAVKDGVIWLTVSSSAPGREGYFTPQTATAWRAKVRSHATAILLDGEGRVGRAYGARATPHMFVIDKAGRIAYMGGIDDRPYIDPESLKGAKPYVAMALADLKAGRPVATPVTAPYGCSVRYASAMSSQ